MPLPRIFIIGSPAAGKTTLRTLIIDWMASQGHKVAILGIEEANRALFPPNADDDTYIYTEEGSIILLQRDTQIPLTLSWLATQCAEAARSTGFILELAHQKIGDALTAIAGDLLQGSLILHLSAPLELRLQRNAQRKALRIPPEIVVSIPEKLTPAEVTELTTKGATLMWFQTSEDLPSVWIRVQQGILTYLESTYTRSIS